MASLAGYSPRAPALATGWVAASPALRRAATGNDYRLGLAVLRLGFEYLSSLELT